MSCVLLIFLFLGEETELGKVSHFTSNSELVAGLGLDPGVKSNLKFVFLTTILKDLVTG